MSLQYTIFDLCEQQERSTIEYLPIPGFPGYRVGNDGSVWSTKVPGSHGKSHGPWRKLKPVLQGTGYLHITLGNGTTNRVTSVHRLVLELFVGPCPEGHQCLHGDGNRANDKLTNLRWGTPSENQADRIKDGTDSRGSKCKTAKLDEAIVAKIKSAFAEGSISKSELARLFNISRRSIQFILNGKTWGHV